MSRSVLYATSPLLASRTPVWRSKFIILCLAIGFAALVARAAWVQVLGNDFFQRQGEIRYARTVPLAANRGFIRDRNGVILASSVKEPSLWAAPNEVELTPEQYGNLARLLGMPEKTLRERLDPGPNNTREFVWLKRQSGDVLASKVMALGYKGIYQRMEYKREYPEGEAAAHVVGFTNIEDIGQEGMELAFQNELVGRAGSARVIRDRFGRVVENGGEAVPPANGRDITLSIDSRIQFFAYQKLRDEVIARGAKAGSVVVIDTHTGEVLALVNYPSYDPNNRRGLTGEQLRNRALTDTFEPGSTMKPIVVSKALDLGLIKPTTIIKTAPGSMVVGGKVIRDDVGYPELSVEQVIQKSSNIGAVRIAMQMTPQQMWGIYTELGLGQRPQVPFPGAAVGRLRPYKLWRPVEQATQAYGYGLSVSLFQLAHAYTAFARDGEIIPVSMLRHDGTVNGMRVFTPKTVADMRGMLSLVTQAGGTAARAQVAGYSVGGKSGTAHKAEGKGYAGNKYRSWFVGLAPIDKPRIVVAAMMDEPTIGSYFGGTVNGPVFAQVVQQTLRIMGVKPDLSVKPEISATTIEENY